MPPTPLYPGLIDGHTLLSEKFHAEDDPEAEVNLQSVAERLLGLAPPAYVGPQHTLDAIADAIVLQINYMMERGIDPSVTKSISDSTPGVMTTYRDRWVDPNALEMIRQVTKVVYVGMTAPGRGI